MASISATSVSKFSYYSYTSLASTPLQFQSPYIKFQSHFKFNSISFNKHTFLKHTTKVRAVEEGEGKPLLPEQETSPSQDQTVSVSVSPSDVLTMFFQAEGTMNDLAIPSVTKALEEVEGIADLKVNVLEGIASVELTKQTTVQATGVASNLVEIIQGSGFKLQTLNLSFQDEEDFS